MQQLTDAQIKAYRIADNRVSQESEWDIDLLKMELKDLKDIDYNLLETGFNQEELDKMAMDKLLYGVHREEGVCCSNCPKCCNGKIVTGRFSFNPKWVDCEYCESNVSQSYLGRHQKTKGDSSIPVQGFKRN